MSAIGQGEAHIAAILEAYEGVPDAEATQAIVLALTVREIRALYKDAERYRRIRENWIDCDELGLHGRLAVIDAEIDRRLLSVIDTTKEG